NMDAHIPKNGPGSQKPFRFLQLGCVQNVSLVKQKLLANEGFFGDHVNFIGGRVREPVVKEGACLKNILAANFDVPDPNRARERWRCYRRFDRWMDNAG